MKMVFPRLVRCLSTLSNPLSWYAVLGNDEKKRLYVALIYIIEDDGSIRELMEYTLSKAGYEVRGFEDASAFREALATTVPDLVILDLMLPKEDGISVLARLREHPGTKELPVLIASAKGSEFDKVKGLDLGADDYLSKPFGMMELVSRVGALLRRAAPKQSTMICMAGLTLDRSAHRLTVNGTEQELTLKEFKILELLMSHPDRVFSREEIFEHVWGSTYLGESRTVDVHMATLRTKLDDASPLIKTVRGLGYKLVKKP